MFTIAKLIELLTVQERTLAQVRQELPPIHHKHLQVRCSWNAKGSLMRLLVEENKREQVELIDGVKIHESETDWVLVLPDAGDPLVHLYADGDSKQKVDHLCREYRERVNTVSREDRETDEV